MAKAPDSMSGRKLSKSQRWYLGKNYFIRKGSRITVATVTDTYKYLLLQGAGELLLQTGEKLKLSVQTNE